MDSPQRFRTASTIDWLRQCFSAVGSSNLRPRTGFLRGHFDLRLSLCPSFCASLNRLCCSLGEPIIYTTIQAR